MPPLNRHQFGGALGGAVVIPGLYDGHDRTFFFADYAGIKERRGVTTVNTVPSAAARIGDFSNYRDRSGQSHPDLRPAHDEAESELQLVLAGERDEPAVSPRPVPEQHHPGRPHPSGRPQYRQHLPAAQQRVGQFRQLHLDARSRDHRPRLLGARRSPLHGQRLGLRAVQLREVQPRRAAGPGQLLPADARRRRGSLRSRPLRRRHPEHAPDDAWRRVQLLEGADTHLRERAARRLCQDQSLHDAVRLRAQLRDVARHPGHQRQRHHDRPAEHRHHQLHGHLGRARVSSGQPEPVALPDRKCPGLDQGAPPDEVRIQARRSRALADDPRQHAQPHHLWHQLRQQPGDQHRRHRAGRGASLATSTARPADSFSKSQRSASSSTRRSCRTTSRSTAG